MLERALDVTDQLTTKIEEARRRRNAHLILELDLTTRLTDEVPHDPVSALIARRRPNLRGILDRLRRAKRDDRVRALVVKVGGPRSTLPIAWAQELRDAVRRFRQDGKLAVAWAETFGEDNRGSVPYYLATAFDEVWLQPSGDLSLTGVAAEVPFVRGTLDKLGIKFQAAQRHEYKNAANIFTETGFTEHHREATERLLHSVMDQIVSGVAQDRGLDTDEVRAVVDRAPLTANEALDAGLVDRLGYRDEVYSVLHERLGPEAVPLYLNRYHGSRVAELSQRMAQAHRPVIAVVDVSGPIHLGQSGRRPLSQSSAGSDTVTGALRAATKDQDVKAIILRVASPGGSYVASDTIWRQVAVARQAGKPVVVSMGDVAASGGYYVSMGSDLIVAEPGTITGSIGIIAGKAVVAELAERVGVTHEAVTTAANSLMFSPLREFSEDEWAQLNTWLDRIYGDFIAKVAEGRAMPVAQVDEVARGRVWTGADARDRGLVDELGGLETAVELAKERAGLPAAADPKLATYPRVPVFLRARSPRSSEDPHAATTRLHLDAWGGFAGLAEHLRLPPEGPLTLPGSPHIT